MRSQGYDIAIWHKSLHFSQNYAGGGVDEDEQMADDDEDEDAELDE